MFVSAVYREPSREQLTTRQLDLGGVLGFAIVTRDQLTSRVPNEGYDGFMGPTLDEAAWNNVLIIDDELRTHVPGALRTKDHLLARIAAERGDGVFALVQWDRTCIKLLWLRVVFAEGDIHRGKVRVVEAVNAPFQPG